MNTRNRISIASAFIAAALACSAATAGPALDAISKPVAKAAVAKPTSVGRLRIIVLEEGQPVEAAAIKFEAVEASPRPIVATTDSNGTVRLSDLVPGTYRLTILSDGAVQTETIRIRPGEASIKAFELEEGAGGGWCGNPPVPPQPDTLESRRQQ